MDIDIDYVLKLSRLHLKEDEKIKIEKDLKDIVKYFENLNEVNTEGVEPTFHAIKNKNIFREDKVKDFKDKEKILNNAPEKEDRFFKVKRIIEDI